MNVKRNGVTVIFNKNMDSSIKNNKGRKVSDGKKEKNKRINCDGTNVKMS